MKISYWVILILVATAATASLVEYALKPWDGAGPIAKRTNFLPHTSSTSAADLKGWQTYTNSQYGFELKYPAEWSFKENLAKDSNPKSIDFGLGSDLDANKNSFSITIYSLQGSGINTVAEYTAHFETIVGKMEDTTIGNTEAKEILFHPKSNPSESDYDLRLIKNDFGFNFDTWQDGESSQNITIAKTILGSLEFNNY